ncbi:MAG: hypothetical protein IKU65_03580 [Oscillospiraceae bacterium]|nr:hypothetical protein [Oscillospiraceae bacterium]
MNGIENIKKRITEDAESKASVILEEAKQKAAEISAGYKEKCDKIISDETARAEKAVQERRDRLAGSAALESKKALLAKKQELISEAFSLAEKKLSALSGDELASVLASLALSAADGKPGEIILSKSVREELSDKISEKVSENKGLKISDEVREISGGLILKSGTTEVNCTFEALVAEKRDEMSREIADILFS